MVERVGGLVQWLASRTTDQGVPGSPSAIRCGLEQVKSHLPPAWYWLNPGKRGRTTDLDRLGRGW